MDAVERCIKVLGSTPNPSAHLKASTSLVQSISPHNLKDPNGTLKLSGLYLVPAGRFLLVGSMISLLSLFNLDDEAHATPYSPILDLDLKCAILDLRFN